MQRTRGTPQRRPQGPRQPARNGLANKRNRIAVQRERLHQAQEGSAPIQNLAVDTDQRRYTATLEVVFFRPNESQSWKIR